MQQYVLILKENGERVTSLAVGIHADTIDELIEYAKRDYADYTPLVADENLQNQLLDSRARYVDGKVVITEVDKEEVKRQQQDDMRARINALRDEKINGGVYVEAIQKWVDTDARAERSLNSIKASFDLFGDAVFPWTCADNTQIDMDKETMKLVWVAMMNAQQQNHTNAVRHKEAMMQSETPLEYDYSDGWTYTYNDFINGVANGG